MYGNLSNRNSLSSFIFIVALLGCTHNHDGDSASEPVEVQSNESAIVANPGQTPDAENLGFVTAVSAGHDSSIQLFVAPCVNNECPLNLRLVRNGEAVVTEPLDYWSPNSREPSQDTWSSFWSQDSEDPAFTLGEGEDTITTSLQLINFNSNKKAALVRQRGGSEHYKRWYYLFEIQDQRFNLVWKKTEGQGPYHTDVVVTELDNNVSELIYLEGFSFQGDNDRADNVRFERLYWPLGSKTLQQEAAVGLPVIWVDKEHASIAAARSALERLNINNDPDGYPCLWDYWVLSGEQITSLDAEHWVLAAISTRRQWIVQETERLKSCIPDIPINIATTHAVKE